MIILEVYKKYNIMPQLEEHQLRVAGVAKLVLDNLINPPTSPACSRLWLKLMAGRPNPSSGRRGIILACLLHDMGNIIKFNLSETDKVFPGEFTKEKLEYWQSIQADYKQKYGSDEHHASLAIAKELGVGGRVIELIDCIGFQNGKSNADTKDFGKKICAYSDLRVGPKGVISLEKRFQDLRVRYDHKHILMGGNEKMRLEFEQGLREIEQQIFENCKITSEDITDETVERELKSLRSIDV